MAGLNKATLIGHLGADPEIRRTQGGDPVATFNIATSESWKDKATGEKRERTEWHRIVIFGEGLAGIAEKYLKKGSKAYVEGQLRTREWTDKEGVKRYTTEVVLTGFDSKLLLLDRAERAPAPTQESYGATRPGPSTGAGAGKRPDIDDEIPF